jgi:hypothetical protein
LSIQRERDNEKGNLTRRFPLIYADVGRLPLFVQLILIGLREERISEVHGHVRLEIDLRAGLDFLAVEGDVRARHDFYIIGLVHKSDERLKALRRKGTMRMYASTLSPGGTRMLVVPLKGWTGMAAPS